MSVYEITLKQHRKYSRQKVNHIERGYNALANKDSKYAREVKAMLDLYKMVDQVWHTAPSEVK